MTTTARHIIAWGAASVWLIPSALSNIRPHYLAGEWAATANQSLFVLALATLPLIALSVPKIALRAGCVALGLGLFCWSLYNALHMGHAAQAAATSPAQLIRAQAGAIKAEIAQYEAAKKAVPAHDVTPEESVISAQKALDGAVAAAAAECKTGRGPNCLQREAAVEPLRKASDKTAASRGFTVIVSGIDDKITDARRRLADLGQVPDAGDTAAALIGDIGHVGESKVSKSLLLLYALVVEGMAFIGPAATLYAAGVQSPRTETPPTPSRLPAETAALPAPAARKSRKKTETGTETDAEQVRRWLKARTEPAPGELLKCGLALDDYKRWHRAEKIKTLPLNQTTFGLALKEIGVQREDKKRSGCYHYCGLALVGHPALKVIAGAA